MSVVTWQALFWLVAAILMLIAAFPVTSRIDLFKLSLFFVILAVSLPTLTHLGS